MPNRKKSNISRKLPLVTRRMVFSVSTFLASMASLRWPGASLLRQRDIVLPDYLAPHLAFGGDERVELHRRPVLQDGAKLFGTRRHDIHLRDLAHRHVELVDDRPRRRRRREQAVPRIQDE